VAPTLENGIPVAVAQAWERRQAVPTDSYETPTTAGGDPPSGADRLPLSNAWQRSSKRLVEEPGDCGGRAWWVGGGRRCEMRAVVVGRGSGYGGWVGDGGVVAKCGHACVAKCWAPGHARLLDMVPNLRWSKLGRRRLDLFYVGRE
jgi:hypothetical protein